MEVETQAIEIHQGAGLADARIHHLLEGCLQQVGGRVVGLGAAPAGPIHLGDHHITDGQLAPLHQAGMDKHAAVAAHRLDRSEQLGVGAGSDKNAAITHLAAALAIEGGGIEHQLHPITGPGHLGRLAVHHQGQHAAGMFEGGVALEGGGLELGGHLFDRPLEGEIEAHRRGLGPLALGLHRLLKAGQINAQPVLFGDLLGEFNREAEGVIELKGLLTGDLLGLGRQHLGQELFAPLQGFQEAGLFALQLGADHGAALLQLGIGTGHQGDGGLPHQLEEGPIDAEAAAVAHHPAQQAPQDVAAAQVGGGDAIGN